MGRGGNSMKDYYTNIQEYLDQLNVVMDSLEELDKFAAHTDIGTGRVFMIRSALDDFRRELEGLKLITESEEA